MLVRCLIITGNDGAVIIIRRGAAGCFATPAMTVHLSSFVVMRQVASRFVTRGRNDGAFYSVCFGFVPSVR